MKNDQAVRDKHLLDHFKLQAEACRKLDSPLTAQLVTQMGSDYQNGGPIRDLLHDWPTSPTADALALRLCGALHGAALTGRDDDLAAAYAKAHNGEVDMTLLWPTAKAFFSSEADWVRTYLTYAPQTNEARRSILLLTGFLHLAEQFDMGMHMLELGASAGLNMNWDKFRYELESWSWGPASAVTLSTKWQGPPPPLETTLRILSRAGCDIKPLDLETPAERDRLRSYCWADVPGRMARLEGAIDIALAEGTKPDTAGAADWLEAKLANRPEEGLTVVYHSIFLQYPPAQERARLYELMQIAGASATPTAPLAWVRFEPEILQTFEPDILTPTLDVVTWPGGARRALARSNGHATFVQSLYGT